MSGLKHGEIEVSAEEQRRREQAARERREAERRRQEEERRERERARLTSALRQVEERASHAITQLRMLGVTVESTTAPSVGDDIDALRRSLAQGSSRAATLERQLASLQNELLAEIAACNLMIERANAQLQLARDRAAAHRQELKVPAAMPNVPSTLSAQTRHLLSAAGASVREAIEQLERIAHDTNRSALAQLRNDVLASVAPPASGAHRGDAPVPTDEEERIGERIARLSESALLDVLQAGLAAVSVAPDRDSRTAALEALDRRVTEVERAALSTAKWFGEIDGTVVARAGEMHEEDAAQALAPLTELHARVAEVGHARTFEELARLLGSMETSYARNLQQARDTSARLAHKAESERRNAAFLRALERHGYEPQRSALARVRVPRDGVMVQAEATSDEMMLQVYQHRDYPERRIAIFQSGTDDRKVFALATESDGSLTAKLQHVLDPASPEPEWVDDWCAVALPEAKALLEESGYTFTYESWVDKQDRRIGEEGRRDDYEAEQRRRTAARRQADR